MPFPTLSFTEFLNRHGQAARLVMGDDGLYAPTVRERQQAALLLNEACRWAWKWGGPLMLPCLSQSAEVTPASGVIARADVQDSPRLSVWTTNPESSYQADDGLWRGYLRLAVPCAGGWQMIDAENSSDPVTAYFQSEVPRFTGIAWVTDTDYAEGALVFQSDECYRCLEAHTSGTFATDLADDKWRVQRVPEDMADAIAARMMEDSAAFVESRPGKQQVQASDAENRMTDLHTRYLYRQIAPWFLHNGGVKPPP